MDWFRPWWHLFRQRACKVEQAPRQLRQYDWRGKSTSWQPLWPFPKSDLKVKSKMIFVLKFDNLWPSPSTMSMGNLMMASGFLAATSSILTPPSAEAIRTGPWNCDQHIISFDLFAFYLTYSKSSFIGKGQVKLFAGILSLGNHDRVADPASFSGLLGDLLSDTQLSCFKPWSLSTYQKVSNHSTSSIRHLFWIVNQLHSTFAPLFKLAFASTSSQNLGTMVNWPDSKSQNSTVRTWALTTKSWHCKSSAIFLASAAVLATPNLGVGTPASRSKVMETYSWTERFRT